MTELQKTIPSADRMLSMEKALQFLKEAVNTSLLEPEKGDETSRPYLKTFSVQVEMPDALSWLSRQKLFPKLYWMNREKSEWIAGLGEADRIELAESGPNDRSFILLERALQEKHPKARYAGGFCFNNLQEQDNRWTGFSPYLFILPLIRIDGHNGKSYITCSLWLKPEDNRTLAYEKLLSALSSVTPLSEPEEGGIPELTKVSYSPDHAQWIRNCEQVLKCFKEGSMEKVMLARRTDLDFSGPVPAIRFLLNYPFPENSTYRFYFEPVEGHAFFSFTPERLYRRDGDLLLTEALAGTVTKEIFKADDHMASELLLNSEKDIREHRFVKDTIYRELQPVCSDIDMENKLEVLQLNRLAHLYTRCRARLKPEFSNDSTVLRQLHPTPAVGGVPRKESMELILSIEPFCRGWYAAPVGWLSQGAAEFAVGIRSALVNEDKVYLFSGAGLVEGSDPYSEWEEVDQKIGDILAITRQST